MRGSPNFAEREERACARPFIITLDKIGSPAPRFAAPPASLIRPDPAWRTPSRLRNRRRGAMIALYDHIQELRAELRGCVMTRRERAIIEAELARAIAEHAELDRAADARCKIAGR
jgi:hypothetical protein